MFENEAEDDVIPLEITGSVKVYNQAYVDKQEKRIAELEVTNKNISNECHKLVDSLEKKQNKNADLIGKIAFLEKRIERAKECMKKLLFIINSNPANYNCKGLVQDAEDFIHNRTCNIRQLGEHCISETRCIMCDMEDKRK